jgi:hypothetical protein
MNGSSNAVSGSLVPFGLVVEDWKPVPPGQQPPPGSRIEGEFAFEPEYGFSGNLFGEAEPQNTGSFEACVGGLGGTGFNQEAADLINNISGKEGTSRELLAVTWMNESGFKTHPDPYVNGHPEDIKQM